MKRTQTYGMIVGVLASLFATSSTWATLITAIGVDANLGDGWQSTSVPKAFDPDGDNVYGESGYYLYGWADGQTVVGADSATLNVLSSTPSFSGPVTLVSSGWSTFNWHDYARIDDPTLASAPTVANMAQTGIWYKDGVSTYNNLFTFTLNRPVTFRLGVVVDNDNGSHAVGESISVYSGIVAATNTIATLNTVPDYAIWEISGISGDVITVAFTSSASRIESMGLLFDELIVPEPGTVALLAVGGLLIYRRRQHQR